MKARAVIFDTVGDASVLKLCTVDVPDPSENEVRIRVHAFGLNRSEAMFRQGWHPVKPLLPSRIGYEATGIVESVGAGVQGLGPVLQETLRDPSQGIGTPGAP